MTMDAKNVKSARTRAMTAAKRSAGLIAEGVANAQAMLDKGLVPADSFAASITRYEAALERLRLCDQLLAGTPAEAAEPEPAPAVANGFRPDDVALLISALHGAGLAPDRIAADTPLGRLTTAAFPDGHARQVEIAPGQSATAHAPEVIPAQPPAPEPVPQDGGQP